MPDELPDVVLGEGIEAGEDPGQLTWVSPAPIGVAACALCLGTRRPAAPTAPASRNLNRFLPFAREWPPTAILTETCHRI